MAEFNSVPRPDRVSGSGDQGPLPPDAYDPASADVSTETETAPFEPSLRNIDEALRRSHRAEAEATYSFTPDARGAPMHGGRPASLPLPDEDRDDGGTYTGLRDKIADVLPVVSLLMSWGRMYHDRRQRADLDRQLDLLGYPPVERDVARNRIRVPDERQEIYNALAGVGK